jgi:hypothetical protein
MDGRRLHDTHPTQWNLGLSTGKPSLGGAVHRLSGRQDPLSLTCWDRPDCIALPSGGRRASIAANFAVLEATRRGGTGETGQSLLRRSSPLTAGVAMRPQAAE